MTGASQRDIQHHYDVSDDFYGLWLDARQVYSAARPDHVDASLEDAFKRADDVLNNAVAGIAEIINVPGLVNVDFADVQTVMTDKGKAMMGIGSASGLDRARLAAEQAVASPLLDGVDLSGARGVIVNITANRSLKLRETNEVINTMDTPYAVPHNIALTPDARRLYITHSGGSSDKVSVFQVGRGGQLTPAGDITVGFNPFGLSFAR